jgi:hypothetical protein
VKGITFECFCVPYPIGNWYMFLQQQTCQVQPPRAAAAHLQILQVVSHAIPLLLGGGQLLLGGLKLQGSNTVYQYMMGSAS